MPFNKSSSRSKKGKGKGKERSGSGRKRSRDETTLVPMLVLVAAAAAVAGCPEIDEEESARADSVCVDGTADGVFVVRSVSRIVEGLQSRE